MQPPEQLLPYIPETVTVHLGTPANSAAANVTVTFLNYIKNVASSEIYPTWPVSALRANILAQISFALNRVYTEYYRSRGYDFDITNNTAVDQSFINGRDIFDTVSEVCDDIFNSYIRRSGTIEPLFAQYCNGTTTTCDGLSQWGTLELANQGYDSYRILRYYYGDDIEIVTGAPVKGISASYPGTPLTPGDDGNTVRFIQLRLNRVSVNYPSIPKINPVNGVFSLSTENAVREFQRIFNLTVDGVIGRATWYKLQYIYAAVKRLNELSSEGITYEDVSKQYPDYLAQGQTGDAVSLIQYYLNLISQYESMVRPLTINGVYDEETTASVISFQQTYGLDQDGIVGEITYNMLYDVYTGIIVALPEDIFEQKARPFPGGYIAYGSSGADVAYFQTYLSLIARTFDEIPEITPDGVFGMETLEALQSFQRMEGLQVTDYISVNDWNAAAELYDNIRAGLYVRGDQYPGYVISEENAG